MAKTKIDIASAKPVPGKPQALAPISPAELAVTAIKTDGSTAYTNTTSATQTIPVSTKPVSVNVTQAQGQVLPFGAKSAPVQNYPNDIVRFDLFNANNVYLGTTFRVNDYVFDQTTQGQSVILNVEKNTQELGYLAGRYNIAYRFHRNILGSGDAGGHRLSIQEISYNGLEVRVRPVMSRLYDNNSFVEQFERGLFNTSKSELITNLFLFKEENATPPSAFQVFDFVQDRFTIPTSPYSIIFKLTAPLPPSVVVGDELWLAQQVSDDYLDTITLTPPNIKPPVQQIAGPNFDVLARTGTNISTNYKDRDDLITTNTEVKYKLQEKLLSGSLIEGINLNQDFRRFENFISYSSATSRLQGFYYKLRQLESYDSRIKQLTTDLNGLPSSSFSSSAIFTTNLETTRNRRSAILGAFDAYERYLYYESASYETSSYGEFWPTTWPKVTSTKPYVNAPTTSSEGVSWFEGAIASASVYDADNTKSIIRNTPAHIIEDSGNENYLTLLTAVGHYFDDVLPYVQQMTSQYNKDQSISAGLAKDLLFVVGQNLGFDFENGNTLDELWSYALGVDATGSVNTTYQSTTEDTMKEIWKRIVNNLPYLLKTKGTERGLRALINCFGIPDTILRIREYGGHEADFESKTDLTFNRFYYGLKVGYNGQTSGNPNQSIKAPWQSLTQSGLFPETIELRVRMAPNQSKDQTIFEVPDKWKVGAFVSGGYNYLGFYLSGSQGWVTSSMSSSIYDGNWHSIALKRENSTDTITDNQTYSLISKTTNYLKVVVTETSSLNIDGSTSSSYNNSFVTPGNLWIPGSGSYTIAQSHSMGVFSGSVQELRYWSTALTRDILDNHALAPTSFQGNTDGVYTGSTSSFDTLAYRLNLGSDSKKTLDISYPATSSFHSQHPDQTTLMPSASFYNFTSSAYISVVEENSLEWPDLGANRSISNKVRIDSTILNGNQLYTSTRAEKPLTDNYPPDSPRLGVFLSPSNEVNQNIAEQFGGLSIDDYIGDPTYLELDNYPALAQLQREYGKKYGIPNKPNQYARILDLYNSALFQLIKRFVPYRANLQTGLVIEPLLIERSKINIKHPVPSSLHYSSSIDLTNPFPPAGEVEDPTNEPLANYVQEATIGGDESDYLTLQGTAPEIVPINEDAIALYTYAFDESEYGPAINMGTDVIEVTGSSGGEVFEEAAGTIDLGINAAGWNSRYLGSKYVYMTYASSGSSPRTLTYITGSRYDEYQAIQPTIETNTYSTYFAPAGEMYDKNIYYSRLFTGQRAFTASIAFSSSDATFAHPLTNRFGLRFTSSFSGSGTAAASYGSGVYGSSVYGGSGSPTAISPFTGSFYWSLDNTNGLYFKPYTAGTGVYTGSFAIDAFMYDPTDQHAQDYLYKVTLTTQLTGSGGDPKIILYFGSFDSPLSQSYTLSGLQTNTYTTKATGTELSIRVQKDTFSNTEYIKLLDLKVEPLNYRAQVQDYHLVASRGMINARYEGCKLTSTDYNVDSPDTIDNGPVITVTLVGGSVLATSPATQPGTFQIR